jgi:uncharacterized protein (DUF488 family)
MTRTIYTVGHSTHLVHVLVELLHQHAITAVADVRSQPYSRVNPQFNRENLQVTFNEARLVYVFLGQELGARTQDLSCYSNRKVQYDRLARSELFRQGLERIEDGMKTHRIALLCAEKDPVACHRAILVARSLAANGVDVQHILETGALESHRAALDRLLDQLKMARTDLFRSYDEIVAEAYRRRGDQIAYVQPDDADLNETAEGER